MNVNAIIIVGGAEPPFERISGTPLASLDVLGKPVLARVIDRLHRNGVGEITVVAEGHSQVPPLSPRVRLEARDQDVWRIASEILAKDFRKAWDLLLITRLGPYVEIDVDDLLRSHVKTASSMTAVLEEGSETANTFVFSREHCDEAVSLLRSRLHAPRFGTSTYHCKGYSNPLATSADLRRLAIDSFGNVAELAPEGSEIRPGVWVAYGASIDRGARIVAPAFIGRNARLCNAAVVTRCSSVECNAHIGAGTIVDNASILAQTRIGEGLEVCDAVVGLKRFAHLRRRVEIDILDPKLVGPVTPAPLRLLEQAASLAVYLPMQFLRGFGNGNGNGNGHVTAHGTPVPGAVGEEELPANFAGVRRYGND